MAQTHPGNSDDAQIYNATITDDTNIGNWALYLSGLEEGYYDEDGNLWTCTYKVEEILTPQITDHFVTEVTFDGLIDRDNRNITISNVKMDGGMLRVVKQIAEGSDYNTEDPFRITVTLTPPLKPGPEGEQGKREDVFDLGPAEHPHHAVSDYIEIDEEDTILIGTPETSVAEDKTVTITMTLAGQGSFTIKDIRVGTTYEVSEDLSGTHGWRQDGEVAYSNSDKTIVRRQLDTATITNKEAQEVDIKIIKIDEETRNEASPKKLPGATFKLFRYSVPDESTTGTYVAYPPEGGNTATTSSTEDGTYGTLTFTGLPDGYYKISETAAPDGYIKTENNDIYFDIVGGAITRYTGAYIGTPRSSADEIAETSNVAMVTYVKADKTFTVGNTPGQALPHTGGPGTKSFTIYGLILVAGAGLMLWRRRRLL